MQADLSSICEQVVKSTRLRGGQVISLTFTGARDRPSLRQIVSKKMHELGVYPIVIHFHGEDGPLRLLAYEVSKCTQIMKLSGRGFT